MRSILLCCISAAVAFSAAADSGSWMTYRNHEQGYKASFPSAPLTRTQDIEKNGQKARVRMVLWAKDHESMLVGTCDIPAAYQMKGREDLMLDCVMDGFIKKPGATLLQSDEITVAGSPARHAVASLPSGIYVEGYFFLRGQRLFMVLTAGMGEESLQRPDFKRFFSSFDFLGKR